MSDYTPTTDEVMGIYRWRKATERYGVNAVYKKLAIEEAEFDRWLAEVKAQERERIIKLLQRPENRDEWICATRNTVGTYGNTVEFLIALIKGENK